MSTTSGRVSTRSMRQASASTSSTTTKLLQAIDRVPARKRSSEEEDDDEIQLLSARPAKKPCRLTLGPISIPHNDALAYAREEHHNHIHTFCPSDRTNLNRAARNKALRHVVYGMHGNRVIEALVPDPDTRIPWTVPKVTLEFTRVDYAAERQPYTAWSREAEGQPVGPKALPAVRQMTRAEYDVAVERADPRVGLGNRFTYEFCVDAKCGWLPYEVR